MIRTVKRSSDRIDLLQHHRSLTACIEYIIDQKHVEESQADGESHKTMRVVTSLSSGSMYRSDYTIDNARSHGSSISWSLAGFSCGFMSYLRVHEASSRQTLNVESYIRKDVQYHGLVHELMKIRKRKKNWSLPHDMNCNSINRSNNFSIIRTFSCSSILSFDCFHDLS